MDIALPIFLILWLTWLSGKAWKVTQTLLYTHTARHDWHMIQLISALSKDKPTLILWLARYHITLPDTLIDSLLQDPEDYEYSLN